MKDFESVEDELLASTLAMQYAVSALIAVSPECDAILARLSSIRGQTVASTARVKQAIDAHLLTIDQWARRARDVR